MSAFRFFAVAAMTLALAAPAMARDPSRTRLLAAPNPSKAGQSVKLTAEVDGLGRGAPTGTVSFADGAVSLGSATLTFKGAGQATLATGFYHSCATTSGGGVKCWGKNNNGQLGDGTTTTRLVPVAVSGLASGAVAVAAGHDHSCALTSAGAVKCWGWNARGQLGDGTTVTRLTPVAVSGLASGVVAIAVGSLHSCALTSAGAVKCWGDNDFGALGDGTQTRRPAPVAVSGLASDVVAITAGGLHSCALTGAGAVKCWGNNFEGQLGDGTDADSLTPVAVSGLSSGVVAIAAGDGHTCALTSAGAVKCWGGNNAGQIGDGTTTARSAPVGVSGLSSNVVAIAVGDFHSCALTIASSAKCWGLNLFGQLGVGTTTNRSVPVSVSGLASGVAAIAAGGDHTCATTSAGVAKCWGWNSSGQLGDGTNASRRTPTLIPGFTTLVRARARLSTRAGAVGTHRLEASFPGDANHLRSSGPRALTVVK
ncbi:Ig-like domain repeat protein [Methylosinus sp. Sm6]|nr:Ig-like domain repeat protein [Methylosinus sp. Sm6]